MKKVMITAGFVFVLLVLAINFAVAVSEENKSCSNSADCRVTSCGDCVNINQAEITFCEKPNVEFNYTISCECANNKCKSIHNPRNVVENESQNKTFHLSNGRNAEIKIMPDTASATAIARLGDLGFNVTLKEVGKGNETRVVYELTADKEGKMFGLFKVRGKVSTRIDAETGDVVSVKRPWWSFLASGI